MRNSAEISQRLSGQSALVADRLDTWCQVHDLAAIVKDDRLAVTAGWMIGGDSHGSGEVGGNKGVRLGVHPKTTQRFVRLARPKRGSGELARGKSDRCRHGFRAGKKSGSAILGDDSAATVGINNVCCHGGLCFVDGLESLDSGLQFGERVTTGKAGCVGRLEVFGRPSLGLSPFAGGLDAFAGSERGDGGLGGLQLSTQALDLCLVNVAALALVDRGAELGALGGSGFEVGFDGGDGAGGGHCLSGWSLASLPLTKTIYAIVRKSQQIFTQSCVFFLMAVFRPLNNQIGSA